MKELATRWSDFKSSVKLLSTVPAMAFVAWAAERLVRTAKGTVQKKGNDRPRDIPILDLRDETEVVRAMQMRRPLILHDRIRSYERLTPEYLAEQEEPFTVCVAPKDSTFFYGSEALLRISPREFVERVFEERPTSAKLYLRSKDCSLFEHDIKDRIGPYQLYPGTSVFVSHAGSVTRLHYDASHGFLSQIRGTKKVVLFAPDQAFNLYENPIRFVLHNQFSALPQDDCMQADLAKFGRLSKADCFEAILEPGYKLYIPPFWWHQVTSLDPSISVSVAYRVQQQEVDLARCFSPMLKKFAESAGLVREFVPQRYVSKELEGPVNETTYDLDPEFEQLAG